jgi:hypothetical protein
MPQILLDDADIDTALQEMGGIRMTECMNGDPAFIDSGFGFCVSECTLTHKV